MYYTLKISQYPMTLVGTEDALRVFCLSQDIRFPKEDLSPLPTGWRDTWVAGEPRAYLNISRLQREFEDSRFEINRKKTENDFLQFLEAKKVRCWQESDPSGNIYWNCFRAVRTGGRFHISFKGENIVVSISNHSEMGTQTIYDGNVFQDAFEKMLKNGLN